LAELIANRGWRRQRGSGGPSPIAAHDLDDGHPAHDDHAATDHDGAASDHDHQRRTADEHHRAPDDDRAGNDHLRSPGRRSLDEHDGAAEPGRFERPCRPGRGREHG
jgi:hypothetical protein